MRIQFNLFILLLLTSFCISCRSTSEITYFQEGKSNSTGDKRVVFPNFEKDRTKTKFQDFQAIIQPNDVLAIYVSSLSPEGSAFFNETNLPDQTNSTFSQRASVGYMVDINGFIEMPLIGKVRIGGLSTQVARDTLVNRLDDYLQSPSVKIYFENFRVTLLGEVSRPGVYTVTNEKISLPEAIGMAGDLTIFGNRKKVMLIREVNGEKNFTVMDLTSRDLFESAGYYLHSNDVIYVEPVKARIAQSDNFYRVAPLVMSSITLLAVILSRVVK